MKNTDSSLASRRAFLKTCFATGVASTLGWDGCVQFPAEAVYPGWKPGEMDLHFIYTGCGENMFYRLPDGTSILNDTGDFYRPQDLKDVPLLPSPERLGGDWVTRYLQRIYPEKTLDYAIFSHWHSDHIGHAYFDTPETPRAAYRYRTTADGRKINGFLCVAEEFGVKRCFDHQYPARGTYGTQDSSMKLYAPWLDAQKAKGVIAEPFKVGALNQIALQRDPAKYKDVFSIRNVSANGVLWDGANGTRDYAAEHASVFPKKKIQQNMLSMAFVVQYGKFRYLTCGDTQQDVFTMKDGTKVAYEALLGERVGSVTLCKMNHHGCTNAMTEGFVKAVRAQVYTACMWCPRQAHPQILGRLSAVDAPNGEKPLLLPNLVCAFHEEHKNEYGGYRLERLGAAHVVVKVFPGGDAYRIYLLDATDESMRVLATFDRRA